ncbi:amidohydrolase family protein [Nocardia abscessus]|uniref:amidohydrolase family protein n=1 Tax=Nocardia abscessus TaxID=120957 RepID=UPI002458C059|nr:amidohydrolase family protein [Nocardia abscessus]
MTDFRSRSKMNRRRALGGVVAGTLGLAATAAVARATPVRTRQPAPSGAYRIDLHAHFLPPDYRAALLDHGHATIGGYPTPEWSPEKALAFMDYYGIQAQALSVSDPGVSFLRGKEAIDMARYCNAYAAGLFRTHAQRFGAFAVLPMPDIPASIAEAVYALDELHLDGVVLLSAYDGVYLGDPRFEPLMIALNQRNAYVFVHPAAIPADAKPQLPLPDFLEEFTFDTTRAATFMMATGSTQRYPNIRFQLAHAGGTLPFVSHRAERLGRGDGECAGRQHARARRLRFRLAVQRAHPPADRHARSGSRARRHLRRRTADGGRTDQPAATASQAGRRGRRLTGWFRSTSGRGLVFQRNSPTAIPPLTAAQQQR